LVFARRRISCEADEAIEFKSDIEPPRFYVPTPRVVGGQRHLDIFETLETARQADLGVWPNVARRGQLGSELLH